ncbi:MAG: hypothetical protein BZY77_03975 [SAR202 cluster bacterium Io17-Chloro-G5]|nr:MAG: hypothetical protein BZY77_03975 [SAR202 cluster bacterium Io17-Chloro-G5]
MFCKSDRRQDHQLGPKQHVRQPDGQPGDHIEIFHFGACQNLAGKLGNQTGGALVIADTVPNFDSSIINSSSSIINDLNLVNADRINNLCGGTVTVCSIN